MKKLLAIFLALLCIFSSCAVSVGAIDEDVLGDIIEDQFGVTQEKDEADALSYGLHYEMGNNANLTILYKPNPNIRFNVPTYVTVTSDTPIAVNHNWVCWEDKSTGTLYYPGDEILVDGKVTLVAVWEEKTDNQSGFLRSIIAGLQALVKLVEAFLNAFSSINETRPAETTTQATEATAAAA